MDIFNEILSDINFYCYKKEKENEMNFGYLILVNICDIMLDRVNIEKIFNKFLEEFRFIILFEVVDNWNDFWWYGKKVVF